MNVRSIAALGGALPDTAGAVYQHNQSDLEFLLARPPEFVPHEAHVKWEGPDYDACVGGRGRSIKFDGVDGESVSASANGFFRPNPNGDGIPVHADAPHFMDYTDDA